MRKLPQLRIRRPLGYPSEEVRDFEQARYCLTFGPETVVVLEGQLIRSYEELVELASRDCCRDKEYLTVELIPQIGGG